MTRNKTKTKTQSHSQAARRGRGAHQADRERWNRMLIIGGVVAVIFIAVGIIGFGWYQTQIKPLGKTVLQVGDVKFSLAHLERRMSLHLEENSYLRQSYEALIVLPDNVLAQLEMEAKLLERADELNVTVTEEEVDAKIREGGGLAEGVAPNLFAEEFRRQVEDSGLKQNEYRQMVRAQLLEEKVRNYFVYLAPDEEEQVRARWLAVVDDEERAEEALQRLETGEEFSVVAQEVSAEVTSGGLDEPSWSVRSPAFPRRVADFLFEAEPGELSEIIAIGSIFYIAELLEREDDRPLEGQQKEVAGNRNMGEWLLDLDETIDVECTPRPGGGCTLSPEDLNRTLEDIL